MKLLLTIPLVFLSTLCANSTLNHRDRINKSLDDCKENAQSTKEQVECYETYSDSLDLAMNNTYKEVLAKLESEQKKRMREAQRAWVQFRDKEIAAANAIHAKIHGTIRRQYGADKTYSLTEHRLKELEDFLSILINDLEKE